MRKNRTTMHSYPADRRQVRSAARVCAALAIALLLISVPAAQAAGRCSRVAGEWTWFNGMTVVLSRSGSAATKHVGLFANNGSWRCIDSQSGRIRINWVSGGFVDTLTLSDDGERLSGTNQYGIGVSAKLLERGGAAPDTETPRRAARTKATPKPKPQGLPGTPLQSIPGPTPPETLKQLEPVKRAPGLGNP